MELNCASDLTPRPILRGLRTKSNQEPRSWLQDPFIRRCASRKRWQSQSIKPESCHHCLVYILNIYSVCKQMLPRTRSPFARYKIASPRFCPRLDTCQSQTAKAPPLHTPLSPTITSHFSQKLPKLLEGREEVTLRSRELRPSLRTKKDWPGCTPATGQQAASTPQRERDSKFSLHTHSITHTLTHTLNHLCSSINHMSTTDSLI